MTTRLEAAEKREEIIKFYKDMLVARGKPPTYDEILERWKISRRDIKTLLDEIRKERDTVTQ